VIAMKDLRFGLLALSAGLFVAACGDEDGGSPAPSVVIGAPGLVSPADGASIVGQVTLTVSNAQVSGGSGPVSYTFQVSPSSAFTDIAAQAANVPEGAGGQTSWTLSSEIAAGEFFWRARATVGTTTGPFSAAGRFQYRGAVSSGGASDTVLLYDPLTNGTSLGDFRGGTFTPEGWKVEASSNYVVYNMQTIETGFLEFDVKGLDIRNPTRDARHLFFMWDPSLGSDMTENRFRVSLQKLDGRSSINDRWLRMRFITQGRLQDFGSTFRDWSPERTYRIRFQWGRDGDGQSARLRINGQEIFGFDYPRPYIPVIHRIELGAAGRAESPEGAIYSNVAIGTR
jgi:hypothetical protein